MRHEAVSPGLRSLDGIDYEAKGPGLRSQELVTWRGSWLEEPGINYEVVGPGMRN